MLCYVRWSSSEPSTILSATIVPLELIQLVGCVWDSLPASQLSMRFSLTVQVQALTPCAWYQQAPGSKLHHACQASTKPLMTQNAKLNPGWAEDNSHVSGTKLERLDACKTIHACEISHELAT